MKLKILAWRLGFCLFVGFNFVVGAGQLVANDFDATTDTVGRNVSGLETPVNQLVTPAGTVVELPGMRPQALALSPNGQLLVTAGLTHELVVLAPATGKILQHVPLPADPTPPTAPETEEVLAPAPQSQLSRSE